MDDAERLRQMLVAAGEDDTLLCAVIAAAVRSTHPQGRHIACQALTKIQDPITMGLQMTIVKAMPNT